jgi:hypothetical protein
MTTRSQSDWFRQARSQALHMHLDLSPGRLTSWAHRPRVENSFLQGLSLQPNMESAPNDRDDVWVCQQSRWGVGVV